MTAHSRSLACLATFAVLALLSLVAHASEAPNVRTFRFHYEVRLEPVPTGEGPIDVFIPIAQSDSHQDIVSHEVRGSIPGKERTESKYGNRFWHGHVDRSDGRAITVKASYVVRRREFANNGFAAVKRNTYTDAEKREHRLFLNPNRLVPTSGEIVERIVEEIAPDEKSLVRIARATYDYVVDNIEYKKVGTGWGNGDTHWACSAKYGNCTDFHALFNSLARARGIPARFEIGFPVPTDRSEGDIGGYHCWVEFYLPDIGWVPIDASEARKHPEMRDLLFGSQPADRIRFSVGRDLELGAGHTTGPLNYFVYPHVEVGGNAYDKLTRSFSFSEVDEKGIASLNYRSAGADAASTAASPAAVGEDDSLIEPYGFIRLDAIFDDSRMQNSQYAFWVESEDPGQGPENDARFTLHPRLTRFGLDVRPIRLAPDTEITAKAEIDFQNGGKESRQQVRMRHAFFALKWGALEFLGGQTWDAISPLYPAANNDGMMWNAGNLGDRRPQARLTFAPAVGAGKISLAVAATLTGAVDGQDLDDNGELDGFASGAPGFQARLGAEQTLWGKSPLVLGVWGHRASEKTAAAVGGETEFASWGLGADLVFPIAGGFVLEGEGWTGRNLRDVRGGIGQGVNATTGEEIRSVGGWGQLAFRPSNSMHLFGGLSVDVPDEADLSDGDRKLNRAVFGVLRYRLWQPFQIGLEYLHWITEYRNLDKGTSNRINLHLTYFI